MNLACLEAALPKFGILVCNLQTGPDKSKLFFDFVPPYGYQHLVKIFLDIPLVVPEILGRCFHLPDAIKLSEKADAINR